VTWAGESRAAGPPLVVCGDLNVAHTDQDLHPKERKAGAIGQRPEERALFDRLLGQGLVDIGRSLAPAGRVDVLVVGAVAQPAAAEHRLENRLCARLRPVGGPAVTCPVLADIGTSDHAPVMATFR
jgi:exodeoxyribonuclease-3